MPVRGRLLIAAEVALAVVTAAAVLGMGRLFAGHDWVLPLLLNVVAAHAVVTLTRRRGLGLISTAAMMVVGAAVATVWSTHWSSTALGLPGPGAWSAVRHDLANALPLFQEVKPPAPVAPGFVIASVLAIWIIAYVADWAAFRLWVPFEATLPAGTLFLFASLLQISDRGRVLAAALFVSAVLLFLLQHRLAREESTGHWINARGPAGHRWLEVSGVGLALGAVLVGVVVAPLLPGATAPGFIDTRDLGRGAGGRVTLSPLVDIRSRLINQSDVEVFTVRSSDRAYWRLTSLDEFNGTLWTSNAQFPDAHEGLPQAEGLDVPVESVQQQFSIEALAQIWLPAAYRPVTLDSDAPVRYDKESSTLIVGDDAKSSDARTYTVTSSSARFTAAGLDALPAGGPAGLVSHYTELPDGFPSRVTDLAETITADAVGPAAKAKALQDYLRTFEYSTDVAPGQSEGAIESFLFDTKRGYCEQFAGTYAAMARSLGIPARVAVGFTTGEPDPTDSTLFHVRGLHAHAWPEVYLDGAGWVAYEPTPGRGMPHADYTGVPEAQANAADPGSATTAVPTTTEAAIPQTPTTSADEVPRLNTGQTDGSTGGDRAFAKVVGPVRTAALVVLLLGLLYAVLFPAIVGLLRWRRRQAATSPMERIDLAWIEATEAATLVGYEERVSDTYPERAATLALLLPDAVAAATALATGMELAAYTEQGASPDDATAVEAAAAELQAVARAATSWKTRVASWFDPRPALRWVRTEGLRQRRITQTATGDLEQERELVTVGPAIESD